MAEEEEQYIATCDTMKNVKVMTEGEWYAMHEQHGEPTKTYPEPQPRAYRIYTLTCPCGASLRGLDDDWDAS